MPTPATPAVPVPPVATIPTPPAGQQNGRLTIRVQRLSQPLQLEQVVRDPTYDRFRTWTMFIAIISVFLIFGTLMFWLGEWRLTWVSGASVPAPVTNVQTQTATPVAPQPAATYAPAAPSESPDELSPEELNQRYREYLRNRDR